ncbi:hypothetical protein LDENG_00114780, partial [Lucifuga dentata]
DFLKDHTGNHACSSLIYSIFIHVTLLTIISQRIKPYFSFPDILQNLLIFQNQNISCCYLKVSYELITILNFQHYNILYLL